MRRWRTHKPDPAVSGVVDTTSNVLRGASRASRVTTMLDAGVDLREMQIAARHAYPRTTKRYDRARKNLDRPPELHPRRLHGLGHLIGHPALPN